MFLVMNVPYTKVSIKERWVLFRWETALFGVNVTYSSTSCNMDCSDRTNLMVLLISTFTWTRCRTNLFCNRKNLVLKTMCHFNRMGHWQITRLVLGNFFVRFSVIFNSPWVTCAAALLDWQPKLPDPSLSHNSMLGVPKR